MANNHQWVVYMCEGGTTRGRPEGQRAQEVPLDPKSLLLQICEVRHS